MQPKVTYRRFDDTARSKYVGGLLWSGRNWAEKIFLRKTGQGSWPRGADTSCTLLRR
jgi:hypothetical protein